eukprot:6248_1
MSKRSFHKINEQSISDEPSLKRQKLDNTYKIKSIWYKNELDHKQFTQIYKNINSATKLPREISSEIAEFATGDFVTCNNPNCTIDIPILHQDLQIYDNNHNNSHKVGYKHCSYKRKYYCNYCMNQTTEWDGCEDINKCCRALYYAPWICSNDTCNYCMNQTTEWDGCEDTQKCN